MLYTYRQYQQEIQKPNSFHLYQGAQMDSYTCKSDIVIVVGDRGGGKSTGFFASTLPYIDNPQFSAVVLRKEIQDSIGVGGVADLSSKIYKQFGQYKSSQLYRFWEFESGAKIAFVNYSAPQKEFEEQINGKQYCIAIWDECNQSDQEKFFMVMANLRNASGLPTQLKGSCNADPDSWLAKFIQPWWDADSGYMIPDMNGVEMYFCNPGDDITDFVFGHSREEVYELCKDFIDESWQKKGNLEKRGESKLDIILSMTVFESRLDQNEAIVKSGGAKYLGKLLLGSEEQKGRYAHPNWLKRDSLKETISESDMKRMFNNPVERKDGTKYASIDLAGSGGDNSVIIIWDGMHICDIFVNKGLVGPSLIKWVERTLSANEVKMCNMVFDVRGVGEHMQGFWEEALPFSSNSTASEKSMARRGERLVRVYANAKAEVIANFVKLIARDEDSGGCGVSISHEVLRRRLPNGATIEAQLLAERRGVRWREDKEGILQCVDKKEARRLAGCSPDIMLAIIYRMALGITDEIEFVPLTEDNYHRIAAFFI